MNLHENKKLFADAVFATAEYLEINPVFVEKDYWITPLTRIEHRVWRDDDVKETIMRRVGW